MVIKIGRISGNGFATALRFSQYGVIVVIAGNSPREADVQKGLQPDFYWVNIKPDCAVKWW